MSTFQMSFTGRRPTTEKIDQNDAPFVCTADHTVTVGVEDSIPEQSKLDQKDDYVAPAVVQSPAPTPEPEVEADPEEEEEPAEEVED